MNNVATVFGVMGKSLELLPDAATRASFNVIKNQNQFKIGAAGSQFQTASRHLDIARLTFRSSDCNGGQRNRPGSRSGRHAAAADLRLLTTNRGASASPRQQQAGKYSIKLLLRLPCP